MRRIRIKKEIALVWAVTTNGHEESLVGRNLSLFLVDPKYRKTAKTFHIENGNEVHFRVMPDEQPFIGVYTLELWENLGALDQTVVDKRSAFELVKYTTCECEGTVDDIHAAEVFIGAGNLAVGIHGRGIVSVTKVSEDPNDWDYRILYDDGATEIIKIARGEKGLTDEEHAELIAETLAAKSAAQSANLAAALAASKAQEAAEAAQTATNAAEAANAAKEAADAATEAAQEATSAANAAKTAANNAATLANNAAANANTKAALAQAAADATNAAIAAASTATAAANAATAAANTAAEAANTAAATANSAASNASAKATLANNAAVAANAAKDAAMAAKNAADTAAQAANEAAAAAQEAAQTIDAKIGDTRNRVIDMERDFGQYVVFPSVTLSAVQSGKRINSNGEFVTDAAWNIGRLGAVSVGNTYELKMGDASKMVLGTALFVAHTIEKRGTADVDVYTPLFSAMTADIPASGYVCFEAMEAYEDVLVCYRTDVDGANTMLVRRYGTKASIATQINNLKKKVDLKSFADGYYEGMRVGTADNLTPRGTASEEVITDRKTGGTHSIEDGDAVIQRIKGRTLKVVQMYNIPNRSTTKNGVALTMSTDGTFTAIGTCTASNNYVMQSLQIIQGHIYLLLDAGQHYPYTNARNVAALQIYGTSIINLTLNENGTTNAVISTATASGSADFRHRFDINEEYNLKSTPMVFDLTAMFGAGNEPESVQAFANALGYDDISQVPYFAYTEGRLIPSHVEGVKTTWTNEDGTEGMFERKWTETLRRYFPDGLKSAGNVYDEITPTKAIKRVGVVNLGTLNWGFKYGKTSVFQCVFVGAKRVTTYPYGNYCNQINSIGLANDRYGGWGKDNVIAVNYQSDSTNVMTIRMDAYDGNLAGFKAAMQGVLLYYELATPEEYTYDELNLTERVIEGGREMAIVAEGVESAPLVADIVYPIDAYNTIVANRENIGSMASLTTTAKQSLVAAINEINAKVSQIAALAAQSEGGEL